MQAVPPAHILLIGHASQEGKDAYNLRLSKKRANSVKEWLLVHGINVDRIKVEAMGETSPIAIEPEKSSSLVPRIERVRRLNRRVEAIIYDPSGSSLPEFKLRNSAWSPTTNPIRLNF